MCKGFDIKLLSLFVYSESKLYLRLATSLTGELTVLVGEFIELPLLLFVLFEVLDPSLLSAGIMLSGFKFYNKDLFTIVAADPGHGLYSS